MTHDNDHRLTQQQAIDALQRDLCAARADTLRAREERDKARGEHNHLAKLADWRGYQVEKLETTVDELLVACERMRPWIGKAIADGAFAGTVGPAQADKALALADAAIAAARGDNG